MNDTNLIDRLVQKDESALEELIEIYGDLIYRASNKILNNKELSEECVNIVLLKIWDGIKYYKKEEGLFKNWIFTLCKYTAIDIMRKEAKHTKNISKLEDYESKEDNIEDMVLMKEIIGEINKRLDELKEIDKEIFRERFENESKVKDISNKIGITPKAISLRIMRIKKFLKDINRG